MSEEYIYIFINPSLQQNFLKIGMTTRNLLARAKEISLGTGLPTEYTIAWKRKILNCERIEKLIHEKLAKYRITALRSDREREFFNLLLEKAIAAINKIINEIESKKEPSKILILDDDESMRNSLQDFLVNHGYQTYSAIHFDDAKSFLINQNIDIVISDIRRPDQLDLELIKIIKTFYNAEVIVCSGTIPWMYTPEECLDAGASAVFKKPVKLVDILDSLKSTLKKGRNRNRA